MRDAEQVIATLVLHAPELCDLPRRIRPVADDRRAETDQHRPEEHCDEGRGADENDDALPSRAPKPQLPGLAPEVP
jgi:hypothetical protein